MCFHKLIIYYNYTLFEKEFHIIIFVPNILVKKDIFCLFISLVGIPCLKSPAVFFYMARFFMIFDVPLSFTIESHLWG
jgi:hypothetical protein